jgi:tetratricopeptide (TPR) repeat protein
MTDNKIDISPGSDPKIDRYSSDNFKKSLNLAKKLSNSESKLPKDAKYYFDLGLKKLNMEDFNMTVEYLEKSVCVDDELIQEAIDFFDLAISINPLYVDAYIVLAVVQCWMEDPISAIDNYTRAIELDPNNSWTYYWRAHLREEHRDAIVDLDESIRVNPNNVDAYSARASAKCKLENYQGAIYDYNQLIAISPQSYYYGKRASIRKKLGDYQGASEDRKQEIILRINDCNQEIALCPDNYTYYYRRADLKRDLGDYQGYFDDIKQVKTLVIDSCTRRIALDPNDFEAYSSRANAKRDLGDCHSYFDDIKQARILEIDSCTQRIEIDLNDFEAYRDRANSKHNLGDIQGAIDDYNQAIIVFKSTGYTQDSYKIMLTSGIYDELLAIKKHIHDKQGVIDIYTQIIALVDYSGCSRYPYCDRAGAKHNLGDYLGAIEDCNQSIKSESDVVRAYFFRASARNELGNYQEAIDDCDLAIYRYQNEPEYVRGQYFERLLYLRSHLTR